MLCCWLTELHLQKIDEKQEIDEKQADQALKEFKDFLRTHHDALPKNPTFDSISSHGYMNELMFFAKCKQEYKFVIQYYIQTQQFKRALEIFKEHDNPNNLADLCYDFAPILMQHIPGETVKLLTSPGIHLDARRLVPALMKYHTKNQT
eukprot:UN19377